MNRSKDLTRGRPGGRGGGYWVESGLKSKQSVLKWWTSTKGRPGGDIWVEGGLVE